MGDNDGRPPSSEEAERLLDRCLVGAIEIRSSLIKNENGRILQDSAGDGDALAFAARELRAALADNGFIAIRKRLDECMDVRLLGGIPDRFRCGVGPADPDIVLDGPVEKVGIL